MERWCGKVAVVSGASAGIGAACVRALANAGLEVVCLARRHNRLLELKDALPKALQTRVHPFKCDVTQENNVKEAFDWTNSLFGGVHVLINNAGLVAETELSKDNNTSEIRATIDTNILGTIFCTRAAFGAMQSQKNVSGHVIIINSVAGQQVPNLGPDLPSLNVYPATKFALRAMQEIYRQEFQRHKSGVRVTTISPGLVDTDILPKDIQTVLKHMRLPMLQPQDVAEAALWAIGTPPNVQVQNITLKPMGEKF